MEELPADPAGTVQDRGRVGLQDYWVEEGGRGGLQLMAHSSTRLTCSDLYSCIDWDVRQVQLMNRSSMHSKYQCHFAVRCAGQLMHVKETSSKCKCSSYFTCNITDLTPSSLQQHFHATYLYPLTDSSSCVPFSSCSSSSLQNRGELLTLLPPAVAADR